jgi:hypothetical protein
MKTMKFKKIKDKRFAIKIPPNSSVPIETSSNMFKHHVVCLVCGKRGAGKSSFITNYLRLLKEENKADRILVVSPTIVSNQALLDSLGIHPEDCFDPDDKMTIPHLLGIINDERDQYVQDLERQKRYKRFRELVDGTTVPIMEIDPYLFLEFTDELGAYRKPKLKYGHRPCLHIFFDDCQNSRIFGDRRFSSMVIKHRHLGSIKKVKGGHKDQRASLGVSLFIAIQNLKSQKGGCPRTVRNNATQLVIVGKTKDEQELKDLYSSVGGEIDYDQFMEAYKYATAEPHGSFVIDLHPKKEHPSQFRKNLNEFILPCKCKE